LCYRGKALLTEILVLSRMLTVFTLIETTLGLSLFLWFKRSNQLAEHVVPRIK